MTEEYRVTKREEGKPDAQITPPTENARYAGQVYKEGKKNLKPGETVSLQKRAVGNWGVVEEETKES